MRQHTLPEGVVLLPGYGAFAHDPSSRFVKLTEGNIARADFYLARKVVPFDTVLARRRIDSVIVIDSVARSANPRQFKENKNFQHPVDGENIQVDGTVTTTRSTPVTKRIEQKY